MIESILGGLKDQISGDLLQKVGLDSSKAEDVLEIAQEGTKEVMGKEMMSGGLDTVMNLFSNKSNSSAADGLQSLLTTTLINKFMSKLGLSKENGSSLAASLVPTIVSLISKKNGETPDSDTSALTTMFGGSSDDVLGKAKGMLGGMFN